MTSQELPLLWDVDAEKRLIAALAVAPELRENAGELAPADFHLVAAGSAWSKIASGGPVIAADFAEFYQPGEVVPLPEYVAEDARRIRQMAYRRNAALGGQRIARAAYYKPDDLENALKDAGQIEPGTTGDTLLPARQVVSETLDELANREKMLARLVPTGLADLDTALGGGLEPQTLTVLMARPSMGKTAALVQISDFCTARGMTVAVFSKEMSRSQWLRRMAFRRAKASWLAFKQGRLDPDTESAVYTGLVKLAERDTLWIDDSTPQTTSDVLAVCKRLSKRAGRVDLVIADHMRLFSDRADNETHRMGAICWAYKQMAKNLDCACLVAAQLSRGVEGQSDKRPDLKDLRDSGEIEENTDTVIGLYRDSYYTENPLDKTAELIVRKARDGERNARIKFVFMPEYMSFEPIAKGGSDARKSGQPKASSAAFSQSAVGLA